MVKRTTSGISGDESVVYAGGVYEWTIGTPKATKYYQIGGRTVAMRKGAGAPRYLLANHLGSTSTVLKENGEVLATREYWPFGMERDVSGDQRLTDNWFTGQRDGDFDGLGIYDYGARMYSTLVGRCGVRVVVRWDPRDVHARPSVSGSGATVFKTRGCDRRPYHCIQPNTAYLDVSVALAGCTPYVQCGGP